MICSLNQAKERILAIHETMNRESLFYGKLLNWYEGFSWHYGIGIDDHIIFDTGGFSIFNSEGKDIHIVPDVQIFTPDETIERLCYAIVCFHEWDYGLLGWNCEHIARLIASNCAISYEVKQAPFPIPQLNHDGYHPDAVNILNNFINHNPTLLNEILCGIDWSVV